MSYENVARRWALAAFELGKESGNVARLNADLTQFAQLVEGNAELAGVLDNPLVPEDKREAVLTDICTRMGLSDLTQSTLRLMARKRRLRALPDTARQLARLADQADSVLRAEVTSAGPLSETYLGKLRAELERATGKKVIISHKQDKSLIGGVVTKIGDQVIDGSVRARLDTFRESLLRT